MSDQSSLKLYDVHGAEAGQATLVDGEVVFADPTLRWTWVLDARHEPYAGLELAEVLHRAEHARKRYALVSAKAAT